MFLAMTPWMTWRDLARRGVWWSAGAPAARGAVCSCCRRQKARCVLLLEAVERGQHLHHPWQWLWPITGHPSLQVTSFFCKDDTGWKAQYTEITIPMYQTCGTADQIQATPQEQWSLGATLGSENKRAMKLFLHPCNTASCRMLMAVNQTLAL